MIGMSKREQFEELGWPEAQLRCLKFEKNVISFEMTDLLSYTPKVRFEFVEVELKGIEFARVFVKPFKAGCYQEKVYVIDVGTKSNEEPLVFEGVLVKNALSLNSGEYYWIDGEVVAKEIKIKRTGIYKSL